MLVSAGLLTETSSPIFLAATRTGAAVSPCPAATSTGVELPPTLPTGSGSISIAARNAKESAKSATKVSEKAIGRAVIRVLIYTNCSLCQSSILDKYIVICYPLSHCYMQKNFKENLVRVVAVLGLIAVLLLGAWGIIQLAFFIPTLFIVAGNTTTKTTTPSTVPTPAPPEPPPQRNTPAATTPVTKKTAPVKKAATSNSAATYVASGRTQNLYGQPD